MVFSRISDHFWIPRFFQAYHFWVGPKPFLSWTQTCFELDPNHFWPGPTPFLSWDPDRFGLHVGPVSQWGGEMIAGSSTHNYQHHRVKVRASSEAKSSMTSNSCAWPFPCEWFFPCGCVFSCGRLACIFPPLWNFREWQRHVTKSLDFSLLWLLEEAILSWTVCSHLGCRTCLMR